MSKYPYIVRGLPIYKRTDIRTVHRWVFKELRRAILERQGRKCYWCKELLPMAHATFDHLHPVSRAYGSNAVHLVSNLVVACPKCNREKGNKALNHWVDIVHARRRAEREYQEQECC